MRPLAALTTAAFLATACDGDDDTLVPEDVCCDAGGEADALVNNCDGVDFELGSGVQTFLAVDSGDTVYLYRGPQAGYHFFLSVRAKGFDPNDVTVCWKYVFTSGDKAGQTFGDKCFRTKLTNDLGDGWRERVGIAGEVFTEYWNGLSHHIRGKDARVDVTITDTKGCAATDGWDVHIHEEMGR